MKKFVAVNLVLIYILCTFFGCSDSKETSGGRDNGRIETDYFYMTVPDSWRDIYSYSYREAEDSEEIILTVSMNSENEYSQAHLFTMYLMSLDDAENIELALDSWVTLTGVLSVNNENKFLIGYNLASELTCTEKEEALFMQMIEEASQVVDSLEPKDGVGFKKWNDETEKEIKEMIVPCVPISFDVLDYSFKEYQNKTGATFFELTGEGALAPYYLKKTGDINYYYGTDDGVIGVENDEVKLYSGWTSDIVGETTPQLRDVISAIEADELFETEPSMLKLKNPYNTTDFFYWKIENGYIGFKTIGGENTANCYGYVATSVIMFEDIEMLDYVTE